MGLVFFSSVRVWGCFFFILYFSYFLVFLFLFLVHSKYLCGFLIGGVWFCACWCFFLLFFFFFLLWMFFSSSFCSASVTIWDPGYIQFQHELEPSPLDWRTRIHEQLVVTIIQQYHVGMSALLENSQGNILQKLQENSKKATS